MQAKKITKKKYENAGITVLSDIDSFDGETSDQLETGQTCDKVIEPKEKEPGKKMNQKVFIKK